MRVWVVCVYETLTEVGLVPAELNSDFQAPTTRAEFTALAVAFYEAAMGVEIRGRMYFNDTNDINVQKMGYLGVVSGVGDGNFAPDSTLAREQAAVMLARLSDVVRMPLPMFPATFADNGQISGWAAEAVGQMQFAGIMGGTGNNMFSPQAHYTREQSIVTILALMQVDLVGAVPPTVYQPAPPPQMPTAPSRQFDMTDPNVQLIPNFALARTADELRALEEQRLGVEDGGWRNAAEVRAAMHDTHPDRLVNGQTVYEWRFRPIFAWVHSYLEHHNADIMQMTDYQKTQEIRAIIEDGLLEEFIGLWHPNFRFGETPGGDCAVIAEAIYFLMLAMDFELFRIVTGRINLPHGWNAYWDSTVGAIRFVDGNLNFGVWNLFADELSERGFTFWVPGQ
ncbi:MAG: S-layer homology domain-containing protein [Defluviitaleaceae bacterium]|nr:S-layer homology domain-containing protein [Defluviitaleaceae bacterium]MCL2263249.1 S-layer homology domain-containing protein [Defluviitaleaceae bacterium]